MEPLTRRRFLHASLGGLGWLAAAQLAAAQGTGPRGRRGKAFVLWMSGGPSQLETFDPKPGTRVGGPTRAIKTAASGVEIAAGLPALAARMGDVSLLRSVVSKEGDHERGTYLVKTGQRPNAAVIHPALGAICAAELPEDGAEIPRYVSILGSDKASRGGYLGEPFDAFRAGDPAGRIADVTSAVEEQRRTVRWADLAVIDGASPDPVPAPARASQREKTERALRMMGSADLAAFRVDDEPAAARRAYGDTPFGRGCLCARRLRRGGVRCVEIELSGWDTHVDNFTSSAARCATLDPAFATLLSDLAARDLLASTVVLCAGEFGRTPAINAADGRDHHNRGFSVALAGGGILGGLALGETSPDGAGEPRDPIEVADVHATVLAAMGIDPARVIDTPIGRPIRLSEGRPLARLLGTA